MTSYKKVGGGLVQIILFNFCERMTNYKEGGWLLALVTILFHRKKSTFYSFLKEKNPENLNLGGVDLNIIIPLHPHQIFFLFESFPNLSRVKSSDLVY